MRLLIAGVLLFASFGLIAACDDRPVVPIDDEDASADASTTRDAGSDGAEHDASTDAPEDAPSE